MASFTPSATPSQPIYVSNVPTPQPAETAEYFLNTGHHVWNSRGQPIGKIWDSRSNDWSVKPIEDESILQSHPSFVTDFWLGSQGSAYDRQIKKVDYHVHAASAAVKRAEKDNPPVMKRLQGAPGPLEIEGKPCSELTSPETAVLGWMAQRRGQAIIEPNPSKNQREKKTGAKHRDVVAEASSPLPDSRPAQQPQSPTEASMVTLLYPLPFDSSIVPASAPPQRLRFDSDDDWASDSDKGNRSS